MVADNVNSSSGPRSMSRNSQSLPSITFVEDVAAAASTPPQTTPNSSLPATPKEYSFPGPLVDDKFSHLLGVSSRTDMLSPFRSGTGGLYGRYSEMPSSGAMNNGNISDYGGQPNYSYSAGSYNIAPLSNPASYSSSQLDHQYPPALTSSLPSVGTQEAYPGSATAYYPSTPSRPLDSRGSLMNDQAYFSMPPSPSPLPRNTMIPSFPAPTSSEVFGQNLNNNDIPYPFNPAVGGFNYAFPPSPDTNINSSSQVNASVYSNPYVSYPLQQQNMNPLEQYRASDPYNAPMYQQAMVNPAAAESMQQANMYYTIPNQFSYGNNNNAVNGTYDIEHRSSGYDIKKTSTRRKSVGTADGKSTTKSDSGENLYICTFQNCGKSFTRFYNLKSHSRTHTGERPFVCDFENCGARFGRNHDLKRHMRVHTGDKPYKCDVCSKTFSRLDALSRHIKVSPPDHH